jgi:hypothetical protein
MTHRKLFTPLPSVLYSLVAIGSAVACSSNVELADDRQKSSTNDNTGGAASTPETGGAASVVEGSGGAPPSTAEGTGGTPPSTAEETGGAPPSTAEGTGGSATAPIPEIDSGTPPSTPPPGPGEGSCAASPGCKVLSFRSHGEGEGTAFITLPGYEEYRCFGSHFAADESLEGVVLTPVLPDVNVPHHLVLYKSSVPVTNGASEGCTEAGSADQREIGEWAPGSGPIALTGAAAAAATPGDYVLKLHYVNVESRPVGTRAGFDLCVCPK